MITISLCMIVKNEQDTLTRCLKSVDGLVDEIVIVDTGSSDRTKEIASAYTSKIYDFEWIDDFSAARNFAFSKGTMDYLMWLDADDVILEPDRRAFLSMKKSLDEAVDVVMLRYNAGFDEDGNPNFTYFRERIVKRSRRYIWIEPVHEYIATLGANTKRADIAVTHTKTQDDTHSDRNLVIYERRINKGEALSSRAKYYYARELHDHSRYEDAALMFKQYLNDGNGWVEDDISACASLADCYERINEKELALEALLMSLRYDLPRAEIATRIGYYFKDKHNYRAAAFWFELILSLAKPSEGLGFILEDCWGYIPLVELAVCHDALGDTALANTYNERAAKIKPTAQAVLFNKAYFKQKLSDMKDSE